jgi:MFS transporter, FHS family, glucose/mannose:H+ symporter
MQNRPPQKIIFLLTTVCFLAFFIFGFTDNLKGPTLPNMLEELKFDFGVGGNIFFGEYLGFLIATLLTGILADRFGLKMVMLLAGICLALGVGGYSVFQTATMLAASLFVIGLGLGAFELGSNAIIVDLYNERKGLFLNLMAVLHGLGSMIAPLFAAWLFGMATSWRVIYRWDLFLICFFLLLAFTLRFPRVEEKSQLDFRKISKIAFKGRMSWFYGAIALYVAAEIGTASWLVTFLQQARNTSVTASNQSLSLFFATLMCGRLIGGFFVHRIGYLLSIFIASLGAVLCLTIGLFGPPETFIFLPITGFFFSIIFPTITAAVSDLHTENINTFLGVLFTFAGLGGIFGPWLVGWGSDLLGLKAGFSINLILAALTCGSIFILMKGARQHGANT